MLQSWRFKANVFQLAALELSLFPMIIKFVLTANSHKHIFNRIFNIQRYAKDKKQLLSWYNFIATITIAAESINIYVCRMQHFHKIPDNFNASFASIDNLNSILLLISIFRLIKPWKNTYVCFYYIILKIYTNLVQKCFSIVPTYMLTADYLTDSYMFATNHELFICSLSNICLTILTKYSV